MTLPNDLAKEFAQLIINDKSNKNDKKETTVYGTAKKYGNALYVQIDGSDRLTPVETTSSIKDGDRVLVLIKNHSATVTGNVTKPSANKDDVKEEVGNQITEFEIVIVDRITAAEGKIDNLQADNVVINNKLTANEGKFNKLESDYGEFKTLTTNKFTANDAVIKDLTANKLSVKDAELKFANIDFANINKAAIENLFSKSGMIGNLVVGDGTISGTLVGVTIKGDLIEGGTIVADKLVVKGTDGIYYKLNTDGEKVGAQQTEYNSLNGSIITAKSVTAEKISVKDLVAFGATIGGFHITDSSLYSGVKESANNTTRGVFLGDDGQFAVGDASNYLKFFKDVDGKFKLAISASAIKLGVSGTSIEEALEDVVDTIVTEYYLSLSNIVPNGGEWTTVAPTWTDGKYVWIRNKTTKKNGTVSYSEPVCLTGASGSGGSGGSDGPIISPIEPPDKTKTWLDTSGTPSLLKRWDGTKWEIVNDVQFVEDALNNRIDETNKEVDRATSSIEILEDRITNLVATYDLEYYKVDHDEVSGVYTKTAEKLENMDGEKVANAVTTTGENVFNGVLNGVNIFYCIVKANYQSLMEQTGDGFSFNLSSMINSVNNAKNDIKNVQDAQNATNEQINGINSSIDSIGKKTNYIQFTTIDGKPGISLSTSDNGFKVVITNESINFINGSQSIAHASGVQFFAPQMVTTNSVQIGESPGFRWERRANGNLGLIYIN